MTSPRKHANLVVIALYLLDGDRKAVDTEDVAIKAYELAPSRFSWKKHPDQINLELVRVSLSDAKKPEKGSLVGGSGKTGWTLTPAGLEWAGSQAERVLSEDLSQRRQDGRGGSIDEQRWRREHDRIVASRAWIEWSSGNLEVGVRDAESVFRIDSYAVGTMRSLKVTRLKSLFAGNDEVLRFLTRMAEIIDNGEPNAGR